MSAQDWFARKLGQVGSSGAPAPALPPIAPEGPAQPAPRGYVPPPPDQFPSPDDLDQMDPSQVVGALLPSMEDKHRQLMARVAQAPLRTQGMAAKTEKERCPGCGGNNFFSRRNGMSRGPAPAPMCWDCGWPLVQYGSDLGAGANG